MINKPPNIIKLDKDKTTIFLAGSIEMGTAEKWQDIVTSKLSTNYNIINPRRDDWDSSWTQDYDNPQFYQQVSWELNGLELADEILFYFDPNTRSPITLLELGLFARSGKCSVICPKGFWRKGNVDIVCNRYNVRIYDNLYIYISDKIDSIILPYVSKWR
jgi:hypothetical protein